MTVIGEAFVAARPDAKGFGADAEKGVLGSVTGIAKKAAAILGGAFAAQKGIAFLKDSVAAARESNAIAAQTAAVIKSTGGAAGVTAKQVDSLSNSIARKTGVDDEQISKAQNLLLTFTNVQNKVGEGNDVFNQATKIATDMGAAFGTDASASAIQLGKALNDPIKGITALSRVGVSFTDEQKKQIETMVKSGDVMGAQKIILAELNKEFGGSAEAQATASDKMKVALGNLQENIGNKLIPVIDALASGVSDVLAVFDERGLAGVIQMLTDRFPFLETPINLTKSAVEKLVEATKAFMSNSAAVKGVLIALAAYFTAVGVAATVSAAKQVAAWAAAKIAAVRDAAVSIAQMVKTVAGWVAMGVQAAIGAAKVVAGWVASAASAVASGAVMVAQFALQVAGWIGVGIQAGISAAVVVASWVAQAAAAVANAAVIAAAWLVAYGPIIAIGAAIVAVAVLIVKNWDTIKNAFMTAVNAVIGFLKANWPTILAILTGPIGLAVLAITRNWDTIKSGVTAVYEWVRDKFTAVVSFISGLPGKITSAARGMWDGITSAFKAAINTIIRGWNRIEFKIPGFKVGPISYGGFTLGVPDIPQLAKGGVVRRTPGGIMANIGEGRFNEAVLPLPPGVIEGLQRIANSPTSSPEAGALVGSIVFQGQVSADDANANAASLIRRLRAEAWALGK